MSKRRNPTMAELEQMDREDAERRSLCSHCGHQRQEHVMVERFSGAGFGTIMICPTSLFEER